MTNHPKNFRAEQDPDTTFRASFLDGGVRVMVADFAGPYSSPHQSASFSLTAAQWMNSWRGGNGCA